ncbi:MAG TPA: hypothetical protein VID48_08320, partial [Solirubrobacteraceae bacterium]
MFALAFGGALLGGALGRGSSVALNWRPPMSDQSLVSPVTPYVVSYPSSPLNRKGTYGALALVM